jgi:hypothetical protein
VADALTGTQLAYSAYGERKGDTSIQAAHGDVSPAPFGVPYAGDEPDPDREVDRSKKCRAKDDTCNGWRTKDSDFCPVHSGLLVPPWAQRGDAEAPE